MSLLAHMRKPAPSDSFSGIYINLDRAPERRRSIEAQLEALGLVDRYVRLSAVDGLNLKQPTGRGPGEIACFRSHAAAVGQARRSGAPVHIMEDDTSLSPSTATFINQAIASGLLDTYDILFLDMWVEPELDWIGTLETACRTWASSPDRGIAAIRTMPVTRIGAASSYLMSPKAAKHVHQLLQAEIKAGTRMPVDSFYGHLAASGRLSAGLAVPFVTSVDVDLGSVSDIQSIDSADMRSYLNLRRAFFIDNDLERDTLPWVRATLAGAAIRGAAADDIAFYQRLRSMFAERSAP